MSLPTADSKSLCGPALPVLLWATAVLLWATAGSCGVSPSRRKEQHVPHQRLSNPLGKNQPQAAPGMSRPQGTAQAGGDPYNSRPAVGPRAKMTYTIKTTTGDLPGAGTSAMVPTRALWPHSRPLQISPAMSWKGQTLEFVSAGREGAARPRLPHDSRTICVALPQSGLPTILR